MFKPKMDYFEVLEVQGIFDLFKDEETVSLRALSNGKISRPTYFKYQKGIAEILNLVINVSEGKIDSLEWKNQCINKVCEFENCKMTEFQVGENIEKETNCYIKTC
mgnify:FL=1